MRFSYDSREFSFFAIIMLSFASGALFGAAVVFFAAVPFPEAGDYELAAPSVITVFAGMLVFPLAAFFLGFSSAGTVLVPLLCALRGFSACLCSAGLMGCVGFCAAFWFYFCFALISCTVFLAFSFFALRSSSLIVRNLVIPELRSSALFGEYVRGAAIMFAILIAAGAAEYCSVPLVL